MQEALSTQPTIRDLCLSAALLGVDEVDDMPITKPDLRRAFASSKTSATREDGIMYLVLRLLLLVTNDPSFASTICASSRAGQDPCFEILPAPNLRPSGSVGTGS